MEIRIKTAKTPGVSLLCRLDHILNDTVERSRKCIGMISHCKAQRIALKYLTHFEKLTEFLNSHSENEGSTLWKNVNQPFVLEL